MGLGGRHVQHSLLIFLGSEQYWGQSMLPAKSQPLLGMEKQPSAQTKTSTDSTGGDGQTWAPAMVQSNLEHVTEPPRLCVRNRNPGVSPGMNSEYTH